jgi:hypothetical protein
MRKAFLPCNPLNVDVVLHGAPPGKLDAAELSWKGGSSFGNDFSFDQNQEFILR